MGQYGWDAAREAAKKASGGRFIRLENDGDKIVVCFLGEIYTREVTWDDDEERYVEAVPGASGRTSTRFSINAYDPARKEIRVFEQGVVCFKQIFSYEEKARNKDQKLDEKYYEIKREGSGKKTVYTVMYDREVPKDELAAIRVLKLLDLAEVVNESEDHDKPSEPKPNGSAQPTGMDPDVATRIVTKLKELPAQVIQDFLKHFGVDKIKAVPRARQDEALAFVERHSQQKQPVDPFAD